MTDGVTVGDARRFFQKATGVRVNHYAMAATDGQGSLLVLGCCDRVDETKLILSGALAKLGAATPVSRSSPYVVVSREDLAALLAGRADVGARDRLDAAARS